MHTETKRHNLLRYALLLLFLGVYLIYTINEFGLEAGIWATALTWSFFIFCTPIADAGFILAFPVRLLVGWRMIYTQAASIFLALFVSLYALFLKTEIFEKTLILKLFRKILTTPWPYWSIIALSLSGTVFSILFADELFDVSSHSERAKYHRHINKHKLVVSFFIFIFTILLYNFLLHHIGIEIPLV